MQRCILLLLCIGVGLVLAPTSAQAHGVTVEHTLEQTLTLSLAATYASGEPMAGAQVTVYAPDDPTTPWQTGTCDDAGRYQFAPDPALVGTWEIQVRQAGHGKTIYIEVGSNTAAPTTAALLTSSSDLPYTPLQRVLMGGAVVWGCIGTALFFARRRS
jgi:nickel transport protein